jgi:predicted Zn-dependent protease
VVDLHPTFMEALDLLLAMQVAGLPSPRDHVSEMVALYDAMLLAAEGKTGEGIERLLALLRESPDDPIVLASLLNQEQRFAETAELLAHRYQDGSLNRTGLGLLGKAEERLGELDRALEVYLGAYPLLPGDEQAVESVQRILRALGRDAEAGEFDSAPR